MEVQNTGLGPEQTVMIERTADTCHYYNMIKKTIINSRSQSTMSSLTESLEGRGCNYYNLENHM